MLNLLTSQISFGILFSLFLCGSLFSIFFKKSDRWANFFQSFFSILGSIWGIIFSVTFFITNSNLLFGWQSNIFPSLSFSFHIDLLSVFFIFIISLITLFCSIYGIGYIKHFYKKYNIGILGFLYNLFIFGMLGVVTASNGIFFLIVWEIMSLASYFLVVYDRNEKENIKAGFLYLVMTHVGTAFIMLAFLLLYKFTGTFDFETIKSNYTLVPLAIKNTVFILALIGFGTKSGIIPFHIWLPSAHPAAPSHVSALMSGVMIKTGIYMMIRVFLDLSGQIPLWWGILILLLGSISAVLGVLYALTEHDIKRLLAYHSIENIGIILLGLGSALIFSSLENNFLALFGLAAALFHTLNHATFKSLLFLSAGSVINQTHTRNMEEYGGLIKYMPLTALFFLIGSMAISALPPFNGFFSEWLTFQALFSGLASTDVLIKSVFILAAAALALTGGLALACFVKAFGVSFLARPRSKEVLHAKESKISLLIGMGALSIVCLLLGLASGYLETIFFKIGESLQISLQPAKSFFQSNLVAPNNFDSVSAPAFLLLLIITAVVVVLVFKFFVNRKQKQNIGATWDCGVDLGPRMEITATGFAGSIVRIFNLKTKDVYQSYFYEPIKKSITALSLRAKNIQSGSVNMYVLYILIAVLLALILL